jgi:hypothetical protein
MSALPHSKGSRLCLDPLTEELNLSTVHRYMTDMMNILVF